MDERAIKKAEELAAANPNYYMLSNLKTRQSGNSTG